MTLNIVLVLRCDLDFWLFDLELLQQFVCHAFKLCTKNLREIE